MGHSKQLDWVSFSGATTLFALSLVSLGSNGCAPSHTDSDVAVVHVSPVSAVERTSLLRKLRAGHPIPVKRTTNTDIITAPSTPSTPAAPVAPGTPTLPAQDNPPAQPTSECQQFRADLGPDFVQGMLSVPEDWNQPRGTHIQVYYYARLERDPSGAVIKPVLFFNGGPAADSHSSYDLLEHRSSAQTLSMIYMDQRGNGCSDPFPALPLNAATARRLTLYGSRSIVRDAEALRVQLLGAQTPWTAFGQSFGGEIVHRYVEMFPGSLSAAFSHGATLVSDPISKISGRLSSQQRVSQDYFAVYPDDAARLKAIRAAIPASQCFDDGTSRVCGSVVMDGVTVLLGFRTEWDSMHEWIGSIMPAPASGTAGKLDSAALSEFVRTFVFGVYASNGFAASVLSYLEVVPGYTDAMGCADATKRLSQSGPVSEAQAASTPNDPSTWPINECRLLSAIHAPWDALIPALGKGDPFSLGLVASQLGQHPAVKFYLYSGEEDVFVPVALFSEETARLGNRINYRNFPNSGHDGFYTEQQVWDDLNSI